MDWFWNLMDAGRNLAPHGYCLLWQPELIWTHVIADTLIAAAYFSIPVALIRLVRRRHDIEFGWVFWLFAVFILACGGTHLMGIWTLWNADYGLEALVKIITAVASVGTAIVLWPLIPKLLAIPSSQQLSRQRDELELTLQQLTHEVAERKRVENALRQAQKMEAVGQLTGGIAHDFNNLLQSVTGSLDLIARNPQSEKVQKWADLGQRAAERGARVTAQLLAFSRTQRLELAPCTVTPLIHSMRELLTSAVGPTIAIEMALEGSDTAHVLGDPTQIELALLNLAINARDAMPDGGTITIRTERVRIADDPELSDGDYLRIGVSDEGIGMNAEVIARAFDPFFTTKGVGKGTGLGLSMVYGVAKQSGGRAEIRSAPGSGTTVSIYLKLVASAAGGDDDRIQQRMASPMSRILVVDDDEDVRLMTASMLESLGHAVIEADSGATAIAILQHQTPDLIILDFAMPQMNGAQVAKRARDMGVTAPILFATGFSESDALTEAAGAEDRIIRKPYTVNALATVIAKCLEGQARSS